MVKQLADSYKLSYLEEQIPSQNWNEVWESNFQPVIVEDFVAIRAGFHPPIETVQHEIVITPKMSFGTGHHATTYMMMRQMRDIDFAGKSVFDFGTGTGVLAILSEKLGAAKVLAIDNDEWSIDNASENIKRNNCSTIEINKAESAKGNNHFDVILANINKNVILDNLDNLASQLKPDGSLLLSGLLANDADEIIESAGRLSFKLKHKETTDNWLLISLSRN